MSNRNAFDAIAALADKLARDIETLDGAALADMGEDWPTARSKQGMSRSVRYGAA